MESAASGEACSITTPTSNGRMKRDDSARAVDRAIKCESSPGDGAPPPSAKEDPIPRIDANEPPQKMGGFARVSLGEDWNELLECAESFFKPHRGCCCKSCDKRRTFVQLSEAIETMKQMQMNGVLAN